MDLAKGIKKKKKKEGIDKTVLKSRLVVTGGIDFWVYEVRIVAL